MPTPRETAGIIADLGRLTTRVEHLEAAQGVLEGLPEQFATLLEHFQDLSGAFEAAQGGAGDEEPPAGGDEPPGKAKKVVVGSVWWPGLSDEDYAEGRRELRGWLRDVVAARYPGALKDLTPCWERHPLAVDLVTAAWLLWAASLAIGSADPREAADWHLRWRPELFTAAGKDCERCRHNGHQPPTVVREDLLASFDPDRAPQ